MSYMEKHKDRVRNTETERHKSCTGPLHPTASITLNQPISGGAAGGDSGAILQAMTQGCRCHPDAQHLTSQHQRPKPSPHQIFLLPLPRRLSTHTLKTCGSRVVFSRISYKQSLKVCLAALTQRVFEGLPKSLQGSRLAVC